MTATAGAPCWTAFRERLEDEVAIVDADLQARRITDADAILAAADQAITRARLATLHALLIDGVDPAEIRAFDTTLDVLLTDVRPEMRAALEAALCAAA